MTLFTPFKANRHLMLIISIIFLIVGSYFLFSDGLNLNAIRSLQALWNLGHVVYFSLFTIIILKFSFFKVMSYLNRCIFILLLTLGLGIGIEALQYGTARSTDMADVAHDLLGSLIILAFYHPALPKQKFKMTQIFKGLVFTLCLVSLWPLVIALWDETHASFQFPILSNFSSPLEINRWSGSADFKREKRKHTQAQHLRIQFNTQPYSGISLKYFNHDWSDYKKLNIHIFNPNTKALFVSIKIYDSKHIETYQYSDRFNQSTKIHPGFNKISISLNTIKMAPRSRIMNINNIISLSLFSVKYPNPETLYLSSVYLSH